MPIDTPSAPSAEGNVLTRKLGPLPTWGWAVVVAGAVLVARALGGGHRAATGGESLPGAPIDAGGDIGLGGGTPGPQGVPGAPGAPGPNQVPSDYTSTLNALLDWFQRLNATAQLIARLRDQIARTNDPARKKTLQAALDKATGKTVISSGKFTYSGATYYQQPYITKIINQLQAKLGAKT
jgi:hypothetical protein